MKHFILSISALFLFTLAAAQTIRPEWDLIFQGAIINDEFGVSNEVLAASGTLAAVRLAPYVGIQIAHDHRVKGGLDVVKNMGATGDKPLVEGAFWYQYNHRGFTLAAGIFPFALMNGNYSTLILSDQAAFYDAHLEGFMLNWKLPRSHYEIAMDWNGKLGPGRREQFNIITSGEGWITPWLAFSWEGMFHHYACSQEVAGVVDDHLLHPFVKLDFASLTPLETLELSLGGVAGYQFDRVADKKYTPLGADVTLEVAKWGFGVRNETYYGKSQAPLYHAKDQAGQEYRADLYFRSPVWQIDVDGNAGFYDRLDIYWSRKLTRQIELGLRVVAHFDKLGILGTQQFFQARVNLEGMNFVFKKR